MKTQPPRIRRELTPETVATVRRGLARNLRWTEIGAKIGWPESTLINHWTRMFGVVGRKTGPREKTKDTDL